MGFLDAPVKNRVSLGAHMSPVIPRTSAAETATIAWATATGYTSDKLVAYNAASSLGLIDRGAKLEASGGWGINSPAISSAVGVYLNPWFIEFWYDGTDIALQMFPSNPSTAEYRVFVDGWAMHDWQYRTYAAGMDTMLKINFATAKMRLYRVYFSPTINFAGLRMPGAKYVYPNPSKRFKVAIIGDSYVTGGLAGASGETTVGASAVAMQIAHLTGWDVYACGVAGTGYVKDVGAGGFTYGSSGRVSQFAALPSDIDLVIPFGGGNDILNGYTSSQVNTAMTTLLNSIASARPGTPIVVSGIQTVNSMTGVGAFSAAMKANALAHGAVRGYIDWTAPAVWVAGSGNSGSQNGSGNADYFISPDNIHPTRSGAEYIARRIVNELRKITI